MTAHIQTPLDEALVELDAAVAQVAGGGRRSRQARRLRAAAARVRAGAAALAAADGALDPEAAFDLVLIAAREAGVPLSTLRERFNDAARRLAGPEVAR